MHSITNKQIQSIHLKMPEMVKTNPDLKEAMIVSYTGDPAKCSTKDLTFDQANALIVRLGGQPWAYPAEPGDADYARFDFKNKQHRLLLSYCHQLGWVTASRTAAGKLYVDLGRLGAWIRKYGHARKKLMEYNTQELPKLCTQLGKVLAGVKS